MRSELPRANTGTHRQGLVRGIASSLPCFVEPRGKKQRRSAATPVAATFKLASPRRATGDRARVQCVELVSQRDPESARPYALTWDPRTVVRE